ncbi:MAG: hypothetical protein M4579_004308 [Chaenotheca gracillima]|nr:MAG: hypothetical protein M4579_004308 [Chaenotheca gracillima]
MAALAASWRLAARKACGQTHSNVFSRGFRASSRQLAASNFTMPAMSPTMTEGNISSWKVKEGDSYSAGDVLLEIETDKAQMDVEAQDDGIVAKIIQGDGSKAVKVGTRIGIMAETGDDPSTMELPSEESAPSSSTKKEDAPAPPKSEQQAEPQSSSSPPASSNQQPPGKPSKQKYPLYPSVQHLLHSKGLSLSDADKIPASGPQGRLLKGDVLSYLGSISSTYSSEQSARVSKLGHLDLSNIKVAPPKEPTADAGPAPSPKPTNIPPPPPPPMDITLPISLSAVLTLQARLEETLDIHLPLSTFISRAATVANANLPASQVPSSSSPDDLFNQVLGLDTVGKTSASSKGHFVPQMVALPGASRPSPASSLSSAPRIVRSTQPDVYDILTGRAISQRKPRRPASSGATDADPATNVFRVTAKRGDEKRAMLFLERVKAVLEGEPGRLIV